MNTAKIGIGTTSHHKLGAVKEAMRRMGMGDDVHVVGCSTNSEVNEQPIDPNESVTGAWNRASQARNAIPDAALWIGIESGVFLARGHDICIDLAVVVILFPDGTFVAATSPGIIFPKQFVETAEARGFTHTTVGSVIAEERGCDPTDPHTALTGGKITRMSTLVQGVIAAFGQTGFTP